MLCHDAHVGPVTMDEVDYKRNYFFGSLFWVPIKGKGHYEV